MPSAVSVLLPVRNAAGTLPEALESLQAQTLANWELVAVDDGSNDATPDLLASAARNDARIRVVRQDALGLVAALNRGWAEAQALLIARMDADDRCHPERLELQVRWMREHPDTGLVGSQVEYTAYDPYAHGYRRHVEWLNGLTTHEAMAAGRFIDSPLAHPSVLFRRDLASRHGNYREGDFPEDYELWLRWFDAGVCMEKIPHPLLVWRDSPGRLSRTDPRYRPEAFARLKALWFAAWWKREAAGRHVWLWGAGLESRKRARPLLQQNLPCTAWIDIDPRKIGRELYGLPIHPVEVLPPPEQAVVLVLAGAWDVREIILTQLRTRGFEKGRSCFAFC